MEFVNEATLQAEFYHACRLIGLPVALEIQTPSGRVDLAITDAARKTLLAVVEVKGDRSSFKGGQTSQIAHYKMLGVPVYGLSRENCPHRLAATIKTKHGASNGVSFASFIGMEMPKRKWREARGILRCGQTIFKGNVLSRKV